MRALSRRRSWRVRGVSLTSRILAVNGIALALLAGSFFYLDSYRKQLLAERFSLARTEAEIAAIALTEAGPRQQNAVLAEIGTAQRLRLTLYNAEGGLVADSFRLAPPRPSPSPIPRRRPGIRPLRALWTGVSMASSARP